MARLIHTPTAGDRQGPFEPLLLRLLRDNLPDSYVVAPNFQLKPKEGDALEYDFLVLAPHALYVLEAKEWYGRLTGDDTEWLINQKPRKPTIWLTNQKCKVLKAELGALANQVYVSPLVVVPDGTVNHVGGNWGSYIRSATGTLTYLQDPNKLPKHSDIRAYHPSIIQLIQGKWLARQQEKRRRIGSYEIIEEIAADAISAEYHARHALLTSDPTVYRIRTFRLDPRLDDAAREKQRAVLRRPTEAVAKIGPHPNLLRVLHFDFDDERGEFQEVTEWSDYGTLHGYLLNEERDRLTLRDRLAIGEGVAAALQAVHAHDIVHRNVCPETILVAYDRTPRLTDFDRAFVNQSVTVYEETAAREKNRAYVPPELSDATDYDFDTASDMYSFGVLLHQLLLDEIPFADAAAARAAAGIPKHKPTERRPDLSPRIDGLLLGLLRVDDFKARPSAAEALAVLRAELGLTTGLAIGKAPEPPSPPSVKLEVGAIVDFAWRIDGELGAGASSKVWRVYNLDHQKSYAMKVLHDAADVESLRHEFNNIRDLLPKHENIARIEWLGRLADQTPYLISELVDGETLKAYCEGTKVLPWRDIQSIGIQLLDALAAMHPDPEPYERLKAAYRQRSLSEEEATALYEARERAQVGVLHRDIKPANIMLEMPSHQPKLIDFNIAAATYQATGQGGTPRYWAPDRGTPKWKPSDDLFSLGVVLYELVLHRHPYPHDTPGDGEPYHPRDICTEFRVSDALDAFLHKAVQPSSADRFQTAQEMKAALEQITAAVAPLSAPPPPPGQFPGLTVSAEEGARKNENPYVTRLLTLYSQARRSNAGTRGLDEIARLTYVETQLDEKLAPDIVSGRFRLVIVTGNAGDGKTAFLQQVERLFDANGADVTPLPTGNGGRWTHECLSYETNYDGSQDEGDRSNDDVLERFFAPFAGSGGPLPGLDGAEVRLIAINEGRLLDFLAPRPGVDRFTALRRFVHRALGGEATEPRALLVNLNLRAVTAGGPESLVDRQLVAMLRPELWAPCEGCEHRDRCPIKHNTDTLRDGASGPAARERIRRLFEIVHLRRQAHVTMRDLRSALSYLLLRDQGCPDIAALLARADASVPEDLSRLYYPDAFADREAEIGRTPNGHAHAKPGEERAIDRLVRRLREADVGLPNDPAVDRRLNYDPETAVPWMTFERRSPHARQVMAALTRKAPDVADDISFADLLAARRSLVARWRRWAYFERRDEGWRNMLPYRATALLERIVSAKDAKDAEAAQACEELRDKVVLAISRAEGLQSDAYCRRYLALKITQVKDAPVRSYRLFPKESFRVTVARAPALAEYLEYAPDAIELVEGDGKGAARLRISLDLLEMLELIGRGYRPTTNELQGLFVNLLIFRNELLTTTFDRVLVTHDDQDFYEIAAEGRPDGIRLRLAKHARPQAGEEGTS